MENRKKEKAITLISLVVTIIVLLILAGVTIMTLTGENGILGKGKKADEETNKQTATEIINLKITNAQIESYTKTQTMPTLQYLADNFYEDNDIEYVYNKSQKTASIKKEKIDVTGEYIYTKLAEYPYEFKIDDKLRLAAVDGIEIADNNGDVVSKEEYNALLTRIGDLEENRITREEYNALLSQTESLKKNKMKGGSITFGGINPGKVVERQIEFEVPLENSNYSVTVTHTGNAAGWAGVNFSVLSKSETGFTIGAYRFDGVSGLSEPITANWILSINE